MLILSKFWRCLQLLNNNDLVMDSSIPTSRSAANRGHILVVDIDAVSRDVIAGLLRHLGCTVDQAADQIVAMGLMDIERYHLVVVDCAKDFDTGIETSTGLLAHRHGKQTPVLALVNASSSHDSLRSAGVAAALKKPVTLRALQRVLDKLLPTNGHSASA